MESRRREGGEYIVVVVAVVGLVTLDFDLRLRMGERACSCRVGVLLGDEDGDFIDSLCVMIDGERDEDCERVILRRRTGVVVFVIVDVVSAL